jgi:hypothetical protein
MDQVPSHVLARLTRSAAMIPHDATIPVPAGVIIRLVAEVEERRREDAEQPDGPFS